MGIEDGNRPVTFEEMGEFISKNEESMREVQGLLAKHRSQLVTLEAEFNTSVEGNMVAAEQGLEPTVSQELLDKAQKAINDLRIFIEDLESFEAKLIRIADDWETQEKQALNSLLHRSTDEANPDDSR